MKIFKIFFIGLLAGLISAKSFAQCPPLSVSSQTINRCGGGNISIQVSANTYNCTTYPNMSNVFFKWYNASSGGTALATVWASSNPTPGVYLSTYSVNVSSTTTFWVSVTGDNGIESSRTAITINIDAPVVLSTLPYPDFNSRCGSGPLTVTVGGPSNATYSWYNDNTTTTPFTTTTAPVWQNSNITTTTTYYVSAQSNIGICPASTRLAVTAKVNPDLAPPTSGIDGYRFGSGSISLTASGNPTNSSIQWFTSATGGTSISTGSALSISNATATATYYAGSLSGGNYCVSTTRKAVTAYVYPVPSIIPVGSSTIFSSSCPIQLTSGSTYPKYEWINSAGKTLVSTKTITVNLPDTYTLRVYIGNPATIPATATFQVINGYNSTVLPLNYIVKKTLTTDNIKDECTVNSLTVTGAQTTITYINGLGKNIQEVHYQASPSMKDIVQPFEYDEADRESKEYLPYAASTSNGNYKTDWSTAQPAFYNNNTGNNADRIVNDLNPFRVKIYDNSPHNVVMKTLPEGVAWQTVAADHSIREFMRTNTAGEVRNWKYNSGTLSADGSTYYSAGKLEVSQSIDEDNISVWEYKDFEGRVVLKKRQDTTAVNKPFLETYYVYDDLGLLRFIIPPQATSLLSTVSFKVDYTSVFADLWLFTFKYDERHRVSEKKVPGASPVYYVYDLEDRMVMTQDGNQRLNNTNQWTYTKYDANNRVIISGIYTHGFTWDVATMQSNYASLNNTVLEESRQAGGSNGYSNNVWPNDLTKCSVLVVSYYDDYDFDNNGTPDYSYQAQGLIGETPGYKYAQGLATGGREVIVGTNNWLWTTSFYDKFNRPVQVQQNNHRKLNAISDIETTVYDFSGKIIQEYKTHDAGKGLFTVSKRFAYDHTDRRIKTWLKTNNEAEILHSQISYNELGQQVRKSLHSENNGTSFLQGVDYTYNIRGWLTHVNNSTLTNDGTTNFDTNDLFGMKLGYEASDGGSVPKYNGSVSSIRWKTNNTNGTSSIENAYRYFYNGLNALKKAEWGTWNSGTSAWIFNGSFREDSIRYDLNGNITKLYRSGDGEPGNPVNLDRLSYIYNGNRLIAVRDSADRIYGFKDSANVATEYTYDSNGNITSDLNKAISSISYNSLDKVQQVQFGSTNQKISYVYNATGEKLQKITYIPGAPNDTTDYISEFVYSAARLSYVETPEGRSTWGGSIFTHQYYLKDHLENLRVEFYKDPSTGFPTVGQENHFYPFGMRFDGKLYHQNDNPINSIRFNSKEEQGYLSLMKWLDYGSRVYDPSLARWMEADPAAMNSENLSPYQFSGNDPVNRIDPFGETEYEVNGEVRTIEDGHDDVRMVVSEKEFNKLQKLFKEGKTNQYNNYLNRVSEKNGYTTWKVETKADKDGNQAATIIARKHKPGGQSYFAYKSNYDKLFGASESDLNYRKLFYSSEEGEPEFHWGGIGGGVGAAARAGVALKAVGPNLSKIASHLHHAWPRYLGGLNKNNLVKMSVKMHKSLHKEMNAFLKKYGMNYSSTNSGAKIQQNFSMDKIQKALSDFYNGPGAKYTNAAEQFFKYIKELK